MMDSNKFKRGFKMKKILAICILAHAFCAGAFADEVEAQALYSKRGENKDNAKLAADQYSSLAQTEVSGLKKAQLLSKEAEAIYFYGSRVTDNEVKKSAHDRGQKTAMVAVGILAAAPGVAKEPGFKTDLATAYYWYGANLGKWGEANGVLASLGRWPELKQNMQNILRLDETVEDFGVYRILGRGYMKVPFESSTEGLNFLKKAYDNTLTNIAGMTLSRNTTTIVFYLDLLKKKEEVETFCQVFKNMVKVTKLSDSDLLSYNSIRFPESKIDSAEFLANRDVQQYAKNECN